MKRRKLSLSKETLTELDAGDLHLLVAGAVADTTVNCPTGLTVCGLCAIAIAPPHLTHGRAAC